jgi:type I restriction enzyme S subunit
MNTGTAVPSMTTEILNNLTLVFPPSNILKSFDDILIPVFEKKSKTKLENQKLTELRDWLLPMLMNGQVKVN